MVSIPFKRESISKVELQLHGPLQDQSFNSLQTGKHIQRQQERNVNKTIMKFQFPSNGKPYPKAIAHNAWDALSQWKVSIPFKRERIYKD